MNYYELPLILAVLHATCEIRLAIFKIFTSIVTWTHYDRRLCTILLLFTDLVRLLGGLGKLRKATISIVIYVHLKLEPSNKINQKRCYDRHYVKR